MEIIEKIAELTARRKLLPFLGAGCSKDMLDCDWDSLIQDMSTYVSSPKQGHLDIAQAYADKYGKEGLCEFLKPYLHAETFAEIKGFCHMSIMCSGAPVIYTTNQDNIMELCMKYFGRKFRAVTVLTDLVDAYPDECLYIKFHGDLNNPDSIVFTESDYRQRMTQNGHFLDIRLRSDLLGRQLLFLGYSFRDPNIQQLFQELQRIAGGHLPPSFLVAYSARESFIQQCKEYNIEVVVPQVLFPDLSPQEAFETFLAEWNRLTFEKFMLDEIHSLFSPGREVCTRMLSPVECRLLEDSLPPLPLPAAIKKFRGLVDAANIPESLQERIANVFFALCQRCETENDASLFDGASFNLHLNKNNLAFLQAAHMLALSNVCNEHGALDLYFVSMPNGFPRDIGIVIGAASIDLLTQWGRTLNPYFLKTLSRIADYSEQYDSFGPETTAYCIQQYNYAWTHCKTTLENPLKRQKRLNAPLSGFVNSDYNKIRNDLLQKMPFTF